MESIFHENQNKSSAKTSKSLTVHRFRIISVSGTNLFRGIPNSVNPFEKLAATRIILDSQKSAKLKVYQDIARMFPNVTRI